MEELFPSDVQHQFLKWFVIIQTKLRTARITRSAAVTHLGDASPILLMSGLLLRRTLLDIVLGE